MKCYKQIIREFVCDMSIKVKFLEYFCRDFFKRGFYYFFLYFCVVFVYIQYVYLYIVG